MADIPRSEYPRPQFARADWMNLNGEWEFEIDNGMSGRARGLISGTPLKGRILVPFCPESALSGVGYTDFMPEVWYRRLVTLPEGWTKPGRRVILNIGASDYRTEVYVNGASAGVHLGGYVSFSMDITAYVHAGENEIVITAEDDVRSGRQPGGKQSTRYHSYGCSYTRTTGIWQTVWLESVPEAYIQRAKYTPDIDAGALYVDCTTVGADGMEITLEASLNGTPVGASTAHVRGNHAKAVISLPEPVLWTMDNPTLYDLTFTLGNDRVESYFGMRSIACKGGHMYLNGKPVFQRLVLDQGFYPDGIYTAPTDEALRQDIEMSMALGFNGARLHQKVFEPRFLYHADRLGYIVWGEMANWCLDISRSEAYKGFLPEWLEALERDFNHPSIVGWCPLNETQRDQDDDFVRALGTLTRAYDPTRPFLDASGWTHVEGVSDIIDLHDYEQKSEVFVQTIQAIAAGEEIASPDGSRLKGVTFVSEYGGIWWSDRTDGWGYGERPKTVEEVLERFCGLTAAILNCPAISGFCYTQLTDVEQEQNGLYTYDRRLKFDIQTVRSALTGASAWEMAEEGKA